MISKFLKRISTFVLGSSSLAKTKQYDIDIQIAEMNLRIGHIETYMQTQASLISDLANIQNNIIAHVISDTHETVSKSQISFLNTDEDDDLIN
tara:strand:- start:139 stop:417 length:279 start_codon:yes stop_codon:yes gene_type:complete